MSVNRREFDEYKRLREQFEREALTDRDRLHGEVRDAAEEIRALRRDLRLIAKLGGVLLSLVGTVIPIATLIVTITRHSGG